MQTKTRMNVYFEPALLKQVEALALRRNVSKSAVIEAAVASFLSEDSAERLEAVFARRMDRLGRQIDCMDQDLAILGETVSSRSCSASRSPSRPALSSFRSSPSAVERWSDGGGPGFAAPVHPALTEPLQPGGAP